MTTDEAAQQIGCAAMCVVFLAFAGTWMVFGVGWAFLAAAVAWAPVVVFDYVMLSKAATRQGYQPTDKDETPRGDPPH